MNKSRRNKKIDQLPVEETMADALTSTTFLAQIYPGRNAVGYDGSPDGDAELRLLVPAQEKHKLAMLPYNFMSKILKVTIEIEGK